MVKFSSPHAPSTRLIFLCPRTDASPQTCRHSALRVLAVRMSYRVTAVLVFRKPLLTLIMAPMRKSSDAGSATIAKEAVISFPLVRNLKLLI